MQLGENICQNFFRILHMSDFVSQSSILMSIFSFIACEQAPKWGIGRKVKSASRASAALYGGDEERKGACGHSLNATVLWYQILVSWSDWLDTL